MADILTAADAQPFGYWVEHKSAENPVLIRYGSFVPASDHYKITALYTTPPAPEAEKLRVAGQALVDALERYGFPVSGGARATLMNHGSNEASALNRAAIAFRAALQQEGR